MKWTIIDVEHNSIPWEPYSSTVKWISDYTLKYRRMQWSAIPTLKLLNCMCEEQVKCPILGISARVRSAQKGSRIGLCWTHANLNKTSMHCLSRTSDQESNGWMKGVYEDSNQHHFLLAFYWLIASCFNPAINSGNPSIQQTLV